MSFLGYRPDPRSSHAARPRTAHSPHSNPAFDSRLLPPSSRGMAGALDSERSRSRRERTFIGSECCVCEEDLSCTLRGEKVLQLSCSHVSHEACFYEYIREFDAQHCPTCDATLALDTIRGGNVNFGRSVTGPRGRPAPNQTINPARRETIHPRALWPKRILPRGEPPQRCQHAHAVGPPGDAIRGTPWSASQPLARRERCLGTVCAYASDTSTR